MKWLELIRKSLARHWSISVLLAFGTGLAMPVHLCAEELYPEKLSEWGQLIWSGDILASSDVSHPYSIAEPLFSDYAVKFRTVFVPKGRRAEFDSKGVVVFPVGSILTKTFAYRRANLKEPISKQWSARVMAEGEMRKHRVELDMREFHLVETRILVRESSGWIALPYLWSDDQSEARYEPLGALEDVIIELHDGKVRGFTYEVPNRHQCIRCHGGQSSKANELLPIGPQHLLLDKEISVGGIKVSQISHWKHLGILDSAQEELARLASESLELSRLDAHLARRYLHVNCAHCHNPNGYAASSGLYLGYGVNKSRSLGVCKPPTSSSGITGSVKYDVSPGEPEASEIVRRMASEDLHVMMPEQGRALRHLAGIELVSDWIRSIATECE